MKFKSEFKETDNPENNPKDDFKEKPSPKEIILKAFDEKDSNEDKTEANNKDSEKTEKDQKPTVSWGKDVSDEELKYFKKNDPGYVTEKSQRYEDEDYKATGYHKVDWKDDEVKGTRKYITVDTVDKDGSPRILEQWSHPGQKGAYFNNPGAKYEDLQLQDVQEKREDHRYEIVKPIKMRESVINDQNFVDGQENNETLQYVTTLKKEVYNEKKDRIERKPLNADDLAKAGYLKDLTESGENTDDSKSSERTREDILEDLKNVCKQIKEERSPEALEKKKALREELDAFDEKVEVDYLSENDPDLSKKQ